MLHPTTGLVTAVGIALCAATGAQAQTTIEFLHRWPEPGYMPYFRQAVKTFEARNPDIDVSMDAVADEPYKDKIRVLMGSDQVPDVYFSWSGEFAQKFARNGRALDITDAVHGTKWGEHFSKALLEPFTFEGKQYGVPMTVDGKFMLYNKAIFEDNGLEKPETFGEFLALNGKLKEAGVTPIAFGNQYPWAASHYIGDLFAKLVPNDIRLGDYNLERPSDELYSHPGYVDALAKFETLNDEGYFNRGSNAVTHEIARGSFLAGRTAMMYLQLVEFAQITQDTALAQDGWGLFEMPDVPDGAGDSDLLTGAPSGFMIAADTEHPEEAIRFLEFLTSPEQAAKFVEMTGMTSAVEGAVDPSNASEQIYLGLKAVEKAGGLALWLDTAMDARTAEVLLDGSQALLNDTETPEAVMAQVQETARSVQAERQ